ncbi:RNA polymerase-associated protein RapA [compost metagenome]
MIRHRRSEVGIKFVDRKVETVRLQGSPEEIRLHDAVVAYVARGLGAKEAKGQKTLAFIRLSRMLSSSPQALAKSAETMATHTTVEEAQDLGRIAALARSIQGSSKLDALRSVLSKVQDKAIVFTGFYETQDFLAERLRADGLKVLIFNGRMSQKEKDRVVAEFKMDADVLLCTDAGSEGVNLQFCHVLVNYDLPWNPMRVEQRIGRVHRIGQTRDVLIINLSIQGTIEDYVLQILEQKIELFTQAVGDTDLILSNLKGSESFEKTIIALIAQAKERGQLEAGFETLGRNLEMAKAAADQIREFDSQTLALLDLSALQPGASAS